MPLLLFISFGTVATSHAIDPSFRLLQTLGRSTIVSNYTDGTTKILRQVQVDQHNKLLLARRRWRPLAELLNTSLPSIDAKGVEQLSKLHFACKKAKIPSTPQKSRAEQNTNRIDLPGASCIPISNWLCGHCIDRASKAPILDHEDQPYPENPDT